MQPRPLASKSSLSIALGLALVVSFAGAQLSTNAHANHFPANKAVVYGDHIEILHSELGEDASEPVEIMNGALKTSNGADFILQITLECALWTDVMTIGNDMAEAEARVTVWVEVDGEVLPVSPTEPTEIDGEPNEDFGKVVFCDRVHQQRTANFPPDEDGNDPEHEIETFLATRTANAFNWVWLGASNLPDPHEVTVWAQLEATGEDTGELGIVDAGVGKRTMVIEQIKTANH